MGAECRGEVGRNPEVSCWEEVALSFTKWGNPRSRFDFRGKEECKLEFGQIDFDCL